MNILHEQDKRGGRFFTEDGLAEIVYGFYSEEVIVIEHTEVDPSLKGKGIGNMLVAAAVDWARAGNLKIIPLCPFAHVVFQRKSEYADVWFHK